MYWQNCRISFYAQEAANMNDLSKISVVLPSLDPDEKLVAVIDGLRN